MITNKLHAVAAALLLGAATIGAGAAVMTATSTPAYAAGVRPEVGKPLQEAQSLAAAGNYKAAMAKVNEAEAVSGKTPAEEQIVAQMKQYIAVKSGDVSVGGALGAKAKFANDYNARKYTDVIADSDALRKTGSLDAQSMQIVAQAYYLSGNKTGCVKYIKANFGSDPGEDTLALLMRCAYDINDDDTQRAALEKLVARTGKPEYWNNLLKLSERMRAISDHQTLDIYRLKFLTGTINGKDEYTTLAQIAMQLGFPGEAVTVIQKAMAANLLNDDRSKRLLGLAKQQAAANAAGHAAALAAASKAPTGDDLIKIAESDWGNGQYQEAVATAQDGLKKNPKDQDNAQIVLGMAYIGAGQKALAVKTLDGVNGGDNAKTVAHLWSLYADTSKGVAAAEPEKATKKRR